MIGHWPWRGTRALAFALLWLFSAAAPAQDAGELDRASQAFSAAAEKQDWAAAEKALARMVELNRAKFGPDHPATLMPLETRAALLQATGDHELSEQLYREALAGWARIGAPPDEQIALDNPPHRPSTRVPAILEGSCRPGTRENNRPSADTCASLAPTILSSYAVDYVNAHGTGTWINDAVETQAIRASFGSAADRLMVCSSKGVLGHMLGAAGAIEATVTLLALYHQQVPPTAGWQLADPECDLDIVLNNARPAAIRRAISNSFAFGGLNAVLAFSASESVGHA